VTTIGEFYADWPHSHPRPTPETNTHYRQMVGRFAARFGDKSLTSITTAEIQVWAMDNVSALRYVRSMFGDAVKDGHLLKNPAAGVKVPRPPRRRRDEVVPTVADVTLLLESADPQLACAIALGGIVGLRWSEILALGYLGLKGDLSGAYVHQQMSRRMEPKPIKGKVLAREVAIFSWAVPYIEAWANDPDASELYVAGPLTHSELRKQWDALREFTEIECEFHQLRTFCATWMLEQGASPIDVAVQLHGHTDPSVVLAFYAMIDKGKALDRLRRVVDGDGE
jgi:integrase